MLPDSSSPSKEVEGPIASLFASSDDDQCLSPPTQLKNDAHVNGNASNKWEERRQLNPSAENQQEAVFDQFFPTYREHCEDCGKTEDYESDDGPIRCDSRANPAWADKLMDTLHRRIRKTYELFNTLATHVDLVLAEASLVEDELSLEQKQHEAVEQRVENVAGRKFIDYFRKHKQDLMVESEDDAVMRFPSSDGPGSGHGKGDDDGDDGDDDDEDGRPDGPGDHIAEASFNTLSAGATPRRRRATTQRAPQSGTNERAAYEPSEQQLSEPGTPISRVAFRTPPHQTGKQHKRKRGGDESDEGADTDDERDAKRKKMSMGGHSPSPSTSRANRIMRSTGRDERPDFDDEEEDSDDDEHPSRPPTYHGQRQPGSLPRPFVIPRRNPPNPSRPAQHPNATDPFQASNSPPPSRELISAEIRERLGDDLHLDASAEAGPSRHRSAGGPDRSPPNRADRRYSPILSAIDRAAAQAPVPPGPPAGGNPSPGGGTSNGRQPLRRDPERLVDLGDDGVVVMRDEVMRECALGGNYGDLKYRFGRYSLKDLTGPKRPNVAYAP